MCLELYWSNLLGVAGPSAQKKNSFSPKMAKKCQFLAKNSVFLENNRVGGTPSPILSVQNKRKKVSFGLFGYKTSFHGIFVPIL